MSEPIRVTRAQAIAEVECPKCRAARGEACWRLKRGGRRYRGKRVHLERLSVIRRHLEDERGFRSVSARG